MPADYINPAAYVVQAPLSVLNKVMMLRVKGQGDVVLLEPILKELVECRSQINALRRLALHYSQDRLLEMREDLEKLLEYRIEEMLITPITSLKEQEYNQQVCLMHQALAELGTDLLVMINAEEPETTSPEFADFVDSLAESALASGNRTAGKRSLMALFD